MTAPPTPRPSSPSFDHADQLITFTQKSVIALNPADGHLLWQQPYLTPYEENNITPLFVNGALILSGLDAGVKAIRPVFRKETGWHCETLWEIKSASFSMSSPVITASGLVIGFSHKNKGQVVAIDPTNGALAWSGTPRQGDNASLIVGAGAVLVLTTESDLIILREQARQYQPVRSYTVADSAVWAHPLPLENGLVIKDQKTLALLSWE